MQGIRRNHNMQQEKSRIRHVLEDLQVEIKQFLTRFDDTYKKNGIHFEVSGCHQMLIRMLTPHQLLDYYGIGKSQELLTPNFQPKTNQFKPYGYDKKEAEPPSAEPKKQIEFESIPENFTYRDLCQKLINSEDENVKEEEQSRGKNTGGKTRLTQEQQEVICEYVRNLYRRRMPIRVKNLCHQAKQLGMKKHSRFTASTGWAKSFLSRHPQIRGLYLRSKQTRYAESNKFYFEQPSVNLTGKVKTTEFSQPSLRDQQYEPVEDEDPSEDLQSEQLQQQDQLSVVYPQP